MNKNFLKTSDFARSELEEIIESAIKFKSGEITDKPLDGKSVALVFFNPSLRTRASMQVGIYELGGNAVVLEPGGTSWTIEHRENVVMDSDKTEHIQGICSRFGKIRFGNRREDFCSFEKLGRRPNRSDFIGV